MKKIKDMVIKTALPLSFSIYLDGLRLLAAVYVFLFHIERFKLGPIEILKWIPNHGHDAVIVFFVLSGYVIAAATDRKSAGGLREYFLDRAARVYSVAIPTLLFSGMVAIYMINFIHADNELNFSQWIITAVINIFFLGQSWSLEQWVPFNQPYWSLCYEVIYYLAFGIFFFFNGLKRYFGLVIVALLAGPKVALLMPCWLFGVAAYRWRDRFSFNASSAFAMGFILPPIVLIILHKFQFGTTARYFFENYFGDKKDYLEFSSEFYIDYVTSLLVAINIYMSRFVLIELPSTLSLIFTRGAAMSFTLYLMHLPMLFVIASIAGEHRQSVLWFVVSISTVPALCYWISQYTELKRSVLRRWLDARIPRCTGFGGKNK